MSASIEHFNRYELPAWHEAFAFTHGRQAINPSPAMFANIYGTYVAHQAVRSRLVGVSSYSEGLAADLNMCIMLALASHNCTVTQAVTLYASYFFGARSAANVTQLDACGHDLMGEQPDQVLDALFRFAGNVAK